VLQRLPKRTRRRTLAVDKGYDAAAFVAGGRKLRYIGERRNRAWSS